MSPKDFSLRPARLLLDHWKLFTGEKLAGPILDLACGDGHNGIFLAGKNLTVICCDLSEEALGRVGKLAEQNKATVKLWQVDLEVEGSNPLPEDFFGGILVFHYLHRPLIPCIKKAIKKGGILIYETFTTEQPKFGKPHNPNFLLNQGELLGWFKDWEIIHHFEGIKKRPKRAVAQIVCMRPQDQ